MKPEDKPIANPIVVLRKEPDDHAILLDPDNNDDTAIINPVGVAVWEMLDGRHSLEQIVTKIRSSFSEVPRTVGEEIGSFVLHLTEIGFVDLGRGNETRREQTGHRGIPETPRTAEILITARCNLSCRYCSFFDDPHNEYSDLPAEEWLRFFEELGGLGVTEVVLSGGEPFIREDLPKLIEGIVRNRMHFAILSNGGLIDDEIAAFVASTGRCNYVQVSVDGSGPETHDVFRGAGSFEGAIRGIRTLQRHRVTVTARVVVHRRNVHDLEATSLLLLEELELPQFSANVARPFGRSRSDTGGLLLTPAERGAAMTMLLRLNEKYGGRITSSSGLLAVAERWRSMEEARAQGQAAFPKGGRLTGCTSLRGSRCAVLADGTITPCARLTHLPLGRINRDSLKDIWQHSPVLDRLYQRQSIPLRNFAFCAGCDYIPYCTGSCSASAYVLTGQVNHPCPKGCLRRYLAEGGWLP